MMSCARVMIGKSTILPSTVKTPTPFTLCLCSRFDNPVGPGDFLLARGKDAVQDFHLHRMHGIAAHGPDPAGPSGSAFHLLCITKIRHGCRHGQRRDPGGTRRLRDLVTGRAKKVRIRRGAHRRGIIFHAERQAGHAR